MLHTKLPICEKYLAEKSFAYSDVYDEENPDASRKAQINWLVKVVSRRGSMTLEEARAAFFNTATTWRDQVLGSKDSTPGQRISAVYTEGDGSTQEDTEFFGDLITTAIKTTDMILTSNCDGELCLQMGY